MHYNKYIPFPNGFNSALTNDWNTFTNINNSMAAQQEKFMYAPTQAPQMIRSPFFDPMNYSFFPLNTACSTYFDATPLAFDNSYWKSSKPNEQCCFTRNSSPINGSAKQVPIVQQTPLSLVVQVSEPYSLPLERYVKTTTTTTNSFTRIEETTCKPPPPPSASSSAPSALSDSSSLMTSSSGNHSSADSSFMTSPRAIKKLSNNHSSSFSEYSDEVLGKSPLCTQESTRSRKINENMHQNEAKRNHCRNRSNTRQLPLRSKGIDMSSFLNSKSSLTSPPSTTTTTSSSISSPGSSQACPSLSKGHNQMRCTFCENNGETAEIYMSHPLKDSLGKVICPVLRSFKCPKCGESGDFAHTNKYCPQTQRKLKEMKIKKCFDQLN